MHPIVESTFGVLLLGGFCASTLSGFVVVQTFLYVKLFPQDSLRVKAIVAVVWLLDTTHSLLVWSSVWVYLITNYGDDVVIKMIPIPLALTVTNTAILTFIVHCFFSYRIHKLSDERWLITVSIVVLAAFRLCCAAVTTAEMIHVKHMPTFQADFSWVFTLGLALSCLVDILITGFLTYLLQSLQREKMNSKKLNRVISAVVVYTFETNLFTSTATTITMICWLAMPNNLIFLAFHFLITKLYANSLLATLNTRKQLQQQKQPVSTDLPAGFSRFSNVPRRSTANILSQLERPTSTKVEITVQQTVEFRAHEQSGSKSDEHYGQVTLE